MKVYQLGYWYTYSLYWNS